MECRRDLSRSAEVDARRMINYPYPGPRELLVCIVRTSHCRPVLIVHF